MTNEETLQQLQQMQSQLAFQEDALKVLNEALSDQQREILVIRRQLELLKQRQDESQAAADPHGVGPADEPPPHY